MSLTLAPPQDAADLTLLDRLADAVGTALDRAHSADRTAFDLASVVAGLVPRRSVDGLLGVSLRQEPRGGSLGGDVVMSVPDGRSGEWLLAADVCGNGLVAATGAAAVRVAMRAVASFASGPAELLALLDGALRPEAPRGGFVTAVAVHVSDGTVRAASAGHPSPLLVTSFGAVELGVEPGPPLALETTERLPALRVLTMAIEPGALLVLYTDGLTDRHARDGAEVDVRRLAAAATGARTPAHAAQAIVDAAEAVGPAEDDTSVLVARLPG
jgi:serine phosphatase RsbU (regulator of sigma subunit)